MTAAVAIQKHSPARRRLRAKLDDDGLRSQATATLQAAVALAVASASAETLTAIIGARGDPKQALAVAPRDLAPVPPERLAAERAAKARTALFRTEISDKAGGMYTRGDVAELLGVTVSAVDKQRARRQILGVPYGNEVRFPAAQFSKGAVVPGLKAVLAAFGDMDAWGQLQLLVVPLEGFGDESASILDLLGSDIGEGTRRKLVGLARGWA